MTKTENFPAEFPESKTTAFIYLRGKLQNFCNFRVKRVAETQKTMTNYEVIVVSDGDPKTSVCFPCCKCNQCMAGREFYLNDGLKYCEECFRRTFGIKCASCRKEVEGFSRVNFVFYDNKVWHEKCFKCSNCKKVFKEVSLPKSGDCLFCTRCGAHGASETQR